MSEAPDFADPAYFARADTTPDTDFYRSPRLVIHVDEHASAALTSWFAKTLPAHGDILDLMSAWRSHLPSNESGEARYVSVTGQGMNVTELNENTALTARIVQDLNALPSLPFKDASFDAVLISFSLQYLTQPIAILRETLRVLRPGGRFHTAYSNRLFPTKAVAVWQACSDSERAHLIAAYLRQAGGFKDLTAEQLVDGASGYDPLYVVSATKS